MEEEYKDSDTENQPLLIQGEGYTLDDAIERIGLGKFHLLFLLLTGLGWIAESCEMMVIAIITPVLKCEWKLSSYEEARISASSFVGLTFGSVFWGYLSNRFGRKKSMVASNMFILLAGILSSQAPSYIWFLVFRLAVGFGIGGNPQVAVILTEVLPIKHRWVQLLIGATCKKYVTLLRGGGRPET